MSEAEISIQILAELKLIVAELKLMRAVTERPAANDDVGASGLAPSPAVFPYGIPSGQVSRGDV